MKTTRRMQRMIRRGPIVKTLFVLGWPIMLMQFFQMAYNLVDTYWLGKLGREAVTAPGLTWPMVFFFVSFASGLSVAGVALVSQYAGAKKPREARRSAGQVMALLTVFAFILSFIGLLLSDWIQVHIMGVPPDLLELISPYSKLIFASMPFMFIMMSYSAILRGWGDTKTPMYISLVSVGINVVLDPIFIMGFGSVPGMGVTGAGIATLIARAIGAGICFYLLFYGKRTLSVKRRDLRVTKDKALQIMKIGVPASVGQAFTALGFIIMAGMVMRLSIVHFASYSVGIRIINITFMITMGLTAASVTMIGQNIGARLIKRAEKVLYRTMLVTSLILLVFSTIFFIFRGPIFGIFINDREVIEAGGRFLMIFGFSIMFFGMYASATSAFQASGHTIPIMVLGIVRLWGLRVPLSFILCFVIGYGADGVWLGMALSNIIGALMALAWVMRGTWKKGSIEEKTDAETLHVSG